MHLAWRLGERYLWLGSLRITQGDLSATIEQLNLMGAIYANAEVTIIAADEDAHVGIQGLRGVF
jgi:hypothetical protein